MREAADDRHGFRLRALIVVLWRGGLRVQEALVLGERDLDPRRGSLLVRSGKGGRRRDIVRVTSYLRDADYSEANAAARLRALGGRRVPTTAVVVNTLSDDWLVDLEIIAAA